MNNIYVIEETIIQPDGGVYEKKIVCGAIDEDEAKHKVKYLNEHTSICQTYSGFSVAYDYKAVSLETQPSWLVNMK